MAQITVAGIAFSGTLTVRSQRHNFNGYVIPTAGRNFPAMGVQNNVRWGMFVEKNNQLSLWIDSADLEFQATVTAAPAGTPPIAASIAGWQAGIIQTLHASSRNSAYTNGINRVLQFDTATCGGLKDGQEGTLFYTNGHDFTVHDGNASADVDDSDAPNQRFPVLYSGNPENPLANPGTLTGTSGTDQFTTWLAVVNEAQRRIVTLGSVQWAVNWAGTFNNQTNVWTPAGPVSTLGNVVDQAHEYDLNVAATRTPFSRYRAEAEKFLKIQGLQGFVFCNPSGKVRDDQSAPATTLWPA